MAGDCGSVTGYSGVQDAVWKSSCCAPNMKGEAFSCARNSALLWTCLPDTLVNTASFAATMPKASLAYVSVLN